jgi:uncharacterized membrane protein YraQ (UPF0718 family)
VEMLNTLSNYILYEIIGITSASKLGYSIDLFIYDTIKILLLLVVIIFAISFIRSFFPPEKTRRFLSRKREFAGNILAALLGVVTALSLPEIIILRQVLKVKLLAVFVAIMTVTIMIVGYLFNAIM